MQRYKYRVALFVKGRAVPKILLHTNDYSKALVALFKEAGAIAITKSDDTVKLQEHAFPEGWQQAPMPYYRFQVKNLKGKWVTWCYYFNRVTAEKVAGYKSAVGSSEAHLYEVNAPQRVQIFNSGRCWDSPWETLTYDVKHPLDKFFD